MHRDRNSSMRASSSSCKAQGEIDDDQDALDRADETLEIWKGAQQAINDAAMNVAQESNIDPENLRPRQQTQNVETNVAFSGSFGVG